MTREITHGYTGYSTHGCRCLTCREAKRAYRREWQEDQENGLHHFVRATEARAKIRILRGAGHSYKAIGSFTGVSYQTLRNIDLHTYKHVRRSTAERILGATLKDLPEAGHLVPKEHAQRLIDAMVASGFTKTDIKQMLGYAPSTTGIQLGRGERITLRSHRRIVTLYQLLARAERVDPSALIGVPR